MKDLKSTVREFAQSVPDYELEHLAMRLSHRLQGDLSYALDAMSRHRGLDSILGSAKSAEELYDLVDEITKLLHQECKKKGLILSKGQVAAA